MRVIDILRGKGREVVSAAPDDELVEVARVLASRRIGAVIVLDDGELVGVLSERDLVRAMALHGEAAQHMHVRDLMTHGVITCGPDDLIVDVMAEMTRSRIRHLPVVHRGELVGVVSIGDVVKFRVEEVEYEASMLREYVAAR